MITALTVDPAIGYDPRVCAFAAAALDQQAQEFAKAWGIDYVPVVYFAWDVLLRLDDAEVAKFVADTRMMTVQPSIDAPGAAGFHDAIGKVIFARCLPGSSSTDWTTPSHERCEMDGDPLCETYVPMGNGKSQAKEASDRVEGDSYIETATIGGDSMGIELSNYLLLPAFIPGSAGPWDRMNRLTSWDGMTDGGYSVIRDANGNETQVFAKTDAGRINLARKLEKPQGRLARRLRGR